MVATGYYNICYCGGRRLIHQLLYWSEVGFTLIIERTDFHSLNNAVKSRRNVLDGSQVSDSIFFKATLIWTILEAGVIICFWIFFNT